MMRYCLNCNKDIFDRHKLAKFCVGCIIIRRKKYRKTKEGRSASARSSRKYNKTKKGIITKRKYSQSPKGKKVTCRGRKTRKKKILNAKEKK